MIDPRISQRDVALDARACIVAAVVFAAVAGLLAWLAVNWASDGCGCASGLYDDWAWLAPMLGSAACALVALKLALRAIRR